MQLFLGLNLVFAVPKMKSWKFKDFSYWQKVIKPNSNLPYPYHNRNRKYDSKCVVVFGVTCAIVQH